MSEHFISIKEMASLHGISRQALILYDKIGLFKPAYITESGYRKYSASQIPCLREICFLKELGIQLHVIKDHLDSRNPSGVIDLLKQKEKELSKQIDMIDRERLHIKHRIELIGHINTKISNIGRPYFEWVTERKQILAPFDREADQMNRDHLHLTLMKAWGMLRKYGMIPSKGFGTLLSYDPDWDEIKALGSIIDIPFPDEVADVEFHTSKEGNYAVMYKMGMPYDTKDLRVLIDWVHEQNYEVCGDIMDMCLLDSTYYNYEENDHEDFCKLYVPVKEKHA